MCMTILSLNFNISYVQPVAIHSLVIPQVMIRPEENELCGMGGIL